MNFWSSEQRSRSASYDACLAGIDSFLDSPLVRQRLGSYVSRLGHLANQSFLPDFKHDKLILSKKQLLGGSIPIIPIVGNSVLEVARRHEQLLFRYNAYNEKIQPDYRSDVYPVSASARELIANADQEVATLPLAAGVSFKGKMHHVSGYINSRLTGRPARMIVSSPYIVVRSDADDAEQLGSWLAHELRHADDLQREGPLYGSLQLVLSSELACYNVSTAHIPEARLQSSTEISCQVECQRRAINDVAGRHPFYPDQRLGEFCDGNGLLG